jgi:hypothetical protein
MSCGSSRSPGRSWARSRSPAAPPCNWLQAIAISEGERRLLAAEGFFAIERRLEEHRVAFWDLSRPSTV